MHEHKKLACYNGVIFHFFSCFAINKPCCTLVIHHRQAIYFCLFRQSYMTTGDTSLQQLCDPTVNPTKSTAWHDHPILIWRLTEVHWMIQRWNDHVALQCPPAKVYKLTQDDAMLHTSQVHRALCSFPTTVVRWVLSFPRVEYFGKTYHLWTAI
jgi:hypothetical protein